MHDNSVISFQELQTKFDIPKQDHYAFLQIRHYITAKLKSPPDTPSYSEVEKFLVNTKNTAHFTSKFYSFILSQSSLSLDNVVHKREKDLGNMYIDDDWREAIKSVRSTFFCNQLRETQYKILHRLHITPVILNKMDRKISPLCVKCRASLGTYFHYFWECRAILRFWKCIALVIGKILNIKLKRDPRLFLLGLPSKTVSLSHTQYKLLDKLLLLARKCILNTWIRETPPSVTQWYREIFRILPHERLAAVLKGSELLFMKIWRPFIEHLPPELADSVLKGQQSLEWRSPLGSGGT